MNVVAVPATVATCTKFVQADPRHRSTFTSLCVVVAFAQVNWIELRDSAVAVNAVGAAGALPFTTIERVARLDAPWLSVTVRDAV